MGALVGAAGLQALGQIGAAALTPAPSYSAAQSDSYQGGVYFAPSSMFSNEFNVVGGGARGGSLGSSVGGGLSLAGNSSTATPTGVAGSTTLGSLLPLILIGGVAWYLLKKKKST